MNIFWFKSNIIKKALYSFLLSSYNCICEDNDIIVWYLILNEYSGLHFRAYVVKVKFPKLQALPLSRVTHSHRLRVPPCTQLLPLLQTTGVKGHLPCHDANVLLQQKTSIACIRAHRNAFAQALGSIS